MDTVSLSNAPALSGGVFWAVTSYYNPAGFRTKLQNFRARDVMWQKERLLNLAIAHLPAQCDKVVWLDAGILFENPDLRRWAADYYLERKEDG